MTPKPAAESAGFLPARRVLRARWWTPGETAAGVAAAAPGVDPQAARAARAAQVTQAVPVLAAAGHQAPGALPARPSAFSSERTQLLPTLTPAPVRQAAAPGVQASQTAQVAPPTPNAPPAPTTPTAPPGPVESASTVTASLPTVGAPGGRGRHARSKPDEPSRAERGPVRRVGRLVGIACLVALLIVGFSIGRALGRPTSDSATAKLAEWARDHHLGPAVSFLEQKQLDLHPAKTGGTVAGGFAAGATASPTSVKSPGGNAAVAHTVQPADLAPFGTAQPGEGRWQVLERVNGQPALEYAGLTPDAVHTSYLATVAWMDPKLLRFELRPGAPSGDPGGTFPGYAPTLAGTAEQQHLVAAFNGGFRLNGESQGGFYLNGRTGRALVAGAASMVVYKNGTVAVGQWGRDLSLSSNVLGVRQNLRLLIDHGTLSPTVDQSNSPVWGYTLGGTQATWRSGVGVTKTGAVVYVDSPALTTRTLGLVLQRAGAVQAMELDINPEWTHLDYFTHAGSTVVPHKLNTGQQAAADHYLATEPSSRDFVAVFARS